MLSPENQADAENRRWARIPALRCGLRHKQPAEPALAKVCRRRGTSFVTTTLARSPRFAFNAATAHRRDSGGSSSVISRTLSLGIAQTQLSNCLSFHIDLP